MTDTIDWEHTRGCEVQEALHSKNEARNKSGKECETTSETVPSSTDKTFLWAEISALHFALLITSAYANPINLTMTAA